MAKASKEASGDACLGGQGGLRVVGVVEADNQAGVLGAVEGDLQSAGLPAVHSGEQQLAKGSVEERPVREPDRAKPNLLRQWQRQAKPFISDADAVTAPA